MALADATGNQTYIAHAMAYVRNGITQFTRNNVVFEGCDDTNTCAGDQIAFRGATGTIASEYEVTLIILGIFYLGLARLYERTRDDGIAQVIEASYLAMLTRVRQPTTAVFSIESFRKSAAAIRCR